MPHNLPEAAVFDLDGVVTFTARVHAAAWKQLFDSYLHSRQQRFGEPFKPFDANTDYRAYVDGRPRYDGVAAFLASRHIVLPYGTPEDPPDQETVCGLGNRKNKLFGEKVAEMGVDVDQDCVRFLREMKSRGAKIGLASSSKNAVPILKRVGLLNLFEYIVDGVVSEKMSLRGKPNPDIFVVCLHKLLPGADPRRSMIAEDAITGVEAGQRGNFGLVLGVDRHQGADTAALRENGATWVIRDFSEITVPDVVQFFSEREMVA
jgi:beta-phosphoglucomutase-like phosphatase (HAD superfamily)